VKGCIAAKVNLCGFLMFLSNSRHRKISFAFPCGMSQQPFV
jgi:hypothetical protein